MPKKKNIIKRVIIITVVINVIIFLVISAKITIQKTREAMTREFEKRAGSFQMPKSSGDGGGPSLFGSGKPACTDEKDYHAKILYARSNDSASRYQEMAPKLRDWFKGADGIVSDEAKKFGVTADLKVFCENGQISVTEVVLPNTGKFYAESSDTRGVLTADLTKLGFNKKNEKYIVNYDGSASGCRQNGSTAPCIAQNSEKGPDDRLVEDNVYNFGPDYAFSYRVNETQVQQYFGTSYDMLGPILILHEYAHTMGAVQSSAPHATQKELLSKQKHCTDSQTIGKGGTDVMCKSDGQGEVFGNACPGMFPFRFDCNNDDYFNPKPEPGSYLATHWNLGSRLNRFIKFGQ